MFVNNINFKGRSEIIYGLNNAAKNARTAAAHGRLYNKNLNPDNANLAKVSMDAYIDMVTADNDYSAVVQTLSKKELTELTQILKPVERNSIPIIPFVWFQESIENAAKNFSEEAHKASVELCKQIAELLH